MFIGGNQGPVIFMGGNQGPVTFMGIQLCL